MTGTGTAGCCARAASGHVTAEPPMTLMKSLRRTQPPAVRLRTTPVFKAYQIWAAMSALGQKQTYAVHNGMSALPPNADMARLHASSRLTLVAKHREDDGHECHKGQDGINGV